MYNQFSKAMFSICIRMTGTRNDAEDVLHESFIIAFQKLHQLKEEQQFGGWLRRIVITECIRFAKKHFYWNDWDEKYEDELSDSGADWYTQIPFDLMQQEIRSLPDGCRQIFNLYVLEDFGHRQIAEQLGISESTSKSQYLRARQLLKERITRKLVSDGSI
ncbi:sigma-70 family RNA polymerase sigma factor [Deminuibacter soli]|uniref:Sigma-70 family RNA polymerase sigma factor n=1 Tax=Deminuibacter soli TaxID=2291815 RepID=A0A3E1NGJ4_9BACT|nr:sigma-70 family RNA polymerase sigma factor [Deminuibacter soli]